MIDAFGWGIMIAPLIAQFALCRFLYFQLRRKVLTDALKPLGACLLFCIVMTIMPWLVAGLTGGLGVYFYTHFPILRPPSWDVGLAWAVFLLLWFSYLISVVCALIVSTELLLTKRAMPTAATGFQNSNR